MNILKIILIILGLVFGLMLAAVGAMVLIGIAVSVLKLVFSLAVIGVIVWFLWKVFASGSERSELNDDSQAKLQKAEMTLDEYKRKIESQLTQGDRKRD